MALSKRRGQTKDLIPVKTCQASWSVFKRMEADATIPSVEATRNYRKLSYSTERASCSLVKKQYNVQKLGFLRNGCSFNEYIWQKETHLMCHQGMWRNGVIAASTVKWSLKRKALCDLRTSFMQVIVTVSLKYLISCPSPKIVEIPFIFSVGMWNSLKDSSLIVFG